MGADHSFYVKTLETHVRTFLPLNISAVCSVAWVAIRTSLILNLPNQTRPHVTSLFHNLIPNHNKERKNESRKSLVKAAQRQQNFRSGAG